MVEVVRLHAAQPEEKPAFCRTPTAAHILNTLSYCHELGDIGVVVGEPGVGKTTAFRHYVAGATHAWLVTGTSSIAALVPCLTAIANTIAGYYPNTGARAIRKTISARLELLDAPKLLILDEAQHLEDMAIEELRSLHDETGMAVVLGGKRDLPARWEDGTIGRGRWAQLVSRIGPQLHFAGARPEDVAAICDHYGVADRGARQVLRKLSDGPGALRSVVKAIVAAQRLVGDGQPVRGEHVEQAVGLRGAGM